MTGVDNRFIITIVVVLQSAILFIVAIRKLLILKKKESLNLSSGLGRGEVLGFVEELIDTLFLRCAAR